MKYDRAKLIYEALKMDARYVNGKLQLRKQFYFNEATGYISYKKIAGLTYVIPAIFLSFLCSQFY